MLFKGAKFTRFHLDISLILPLSQAIRQRLIGKSFQRAAQKWYSLPTRQRMLPAYGTLSLVTFIESYCLSHRSIKYCNTKYILCQEIISAFSLNIVPYMIFHILRPAQACRSQRLCRRYRRPRVPYL